MLALKENQGQLYEDVRDLFEGAAEFGFEGVPHDYATTLNQDHGRIERRVALPYVRTNCQRYTIGFSTLAWKSVSPRALVWKVYSAMEDPRCARKRLIG